MTSGPQGPAPQPASRISGAGGRRLAAAANAAATSSGRARLQRCTAGVERGLEPLRDIGGIVDLLDLFDLVDLLAGLVGRRLGRGDFAGERFHPLHRLRIVRLQRRPLSQHLESDGTLAEGKMRFAHHPEQGRGDRLQRQHRARVLDRFTVAPGPVQRNGQVAVQLDRIRIELEPVEKGGDAVVESLTAHQRQTEVVAGRNRVCAGHHAAAEGLGGLGVAAGGLQRLAHALPPLGLVGRALCSGRHQIDRLVAAALLGAQQCKRAEQFVALRLDRQACGDGGLALIEPAQPQAGHGLAVPGDCRSPIDPERLLKVRQSRLGAARLDQQVCQVEPKPRIARHPVDELLQLHDRFVRPALPISQDGRQVQGARLIGDLRQHVRAQGFAGGMLAAAQQATRVFERVVHRHARGGAVRAG